MKSTGLLMMQRFAIVILTALTIAGTWLVPLESAVNQHIDAGLKRALISFATARALNGVISVAQGTQVAIEPGGVGINLAPGELLDPLNDLIEQFANLTLAASVAFGIEKILVTIGAHPAISIALTLSALLWAAMSLYRGAAPAWLSRTLLLILMVHFALPVALVGSDLLFKQFMQADYQSSQQVIDSTTEQLDQLTPSELEAPQGVIDRFKEWVTQNTDIKSRLAGLKQAAEKTTEHIVRLMAIFLLQTLILPLFLLWFAWSIAKRAFFNINTLNPLPHFAGNKHLPPLLNPARRSS